MIRAALTLLLAATILTACRDEKTALPEPLSLGAEAVGYYCQMNLLEHEGPKAQIHLDGLAFPIFFSQVRDAVAYTRMPEQSHAIVAVYVNDMGRAESWARPGAENWMVLDAAILVLGSRAIGGMGAPEIVPFSTASAAETFVAENGGRIVTLNEIADTDVLVPDTPAPVGDEADIAERLRKLSDKAGG